MKMKTVTLHSLSVVSALMLAGGLHAAAPAKPEAKPPVSSNQTPLKLEDLPAPVRETVAAQGAGAKVESIEQRTKDGATHYVVHFAGKDGRKGRHIVVDSAGKVQPAPLGSGK